MLARLHVHTYPYSLIDHPHAIAVITEGDEFKTYGWLYPAFLFDGRNLLDKIALEAIGFRGSHIGKE